MSDLQPGEEWCVWSPESGEPWEDFILTEVGDVWTSHKPGGEKRDAIITRVDWDNQRVAFRWMAGEA